jgi:hypothetical protein
MALYFITAIFVLKEYDSAQPALGPGDNISRTKKPHIMGHVKVVARHNGISAVSTLSSF